MKMKKLTPPTATELAAFKARGAVETKRSKLPTVVIRKQKGGWKVSGKNRLIVKKEDLWHHLEGIDGAYVRILISPSPTESYYAVVSGTLKCSHRACVVY